MEHFGRKLSRTLGALVALLSPLMCESTTVGVNWDAPTSPLIANVGDSIEFAWNGTHDVNGILNASAFTTCDFSGATMLNSTSPAWWNATAEGVFYFASSIAGDCAGGTKLQVNVVTPTSSPTSPSPTSSPNTSTPTSSSPTTVAPTSTPTPTLAPTNTTLAPTTLSPTTTSPTPNSTNTPTAPPSTATPTTLAPVTDFPTTTAPTATPTPTTVSPSSAPTQPPTETPSTNPTNAPSMSPTTPAPTIACNTSQCQSIRRQNCSTTNTCGDCLAGYTGPIGPSNMRDCVAAIDCSVVNCSTIGRASASGMCAAGYVPSADFQTCVQSSSSSSFSTTNILIIAAAGGGGLLMLSLAIFCCCCRASKPHVRATSWGQPDNLTALDVALSENLQGNPLTTVPSLPPGWEEQRADDGEIYYWHPATERSVWERHEIPNE